MKKHVHATVIAVMTVVIIITAMNIIMKKHVRATVSIIMKPVAVAAARRESSALSGKKSSYI
jgi:Mg2+/citrate symporter